MTKLFATRWALVATLTMLATPAISAQQDDGAPPPSKPGKPINAGEVLSGELNAMKVRGGKKGKRIATYQITSEPRKLPGPDGLCNLETGPETFQLTIRGTDDEKLLKKFLGKTISIQAKELACPQGPSEIADAVVKSWALAQ